MKKLYKEIKSVSIEVNESFSSQYNYIMKFMGENNFKFKQKKHSEIVSSSNFNKSFNYIFEKNY